MAAPPLLALSAAQWAPLREAVPVLGLLRGPLAVAVAVLAAALVATRLFRLRWRAPAASPWLLFALAAVAYASIGLYYAARLQASGDEPHYLLMAQSLWNEGDLDLRDNYERGDFLDYTPGPLRPHYGAPRADGRPYPAHSPGLPALLAPAYALGGRRGAVLLIAVLAAALSAEVFRLARSVVADPDAALLAWSAALGAPVAFYAFHVYTEVPSALALAVSLRLLVVGRAGLAAAVIAALAASALPWLHVKLLPAAAALGAIGLTRLRGRSRWVYLGVALVMAAGYAGYYLTIFGRPTPLAIYGGVPRGLSGEPWRALPGLLLDRSFGLLPVAPVFLLALSGLAGPWRRGASGLWPGALLLVAVLAPVLWWRMWWGGYCPPARFLVPAVPLLACAAALRVAGSPRGLARWRWVLVALGLGLAAYSVHRPVDRLLLDRRAQPTRVWSWLAGFEEPTLGRYLPSLVSRNPEELRVVAVWIGALALLFGLDAWARRHERVDRWFAGTWLPVGLLLAGGTLIDGWARAGDLRRGAPASAEPALTLATWSSARAPGPAAGRGRAPSGPWRLSQRARSPGPADPGPPAAGSGGRSALPERAEMPVSRPRRVSRSTEKVDTCCLVTVQGSQSFDRVVVHRAHRDGACLARVSLHRGLGVHHGVLRREPAVRASAIARAVVRGWPAP